MPLPTEKKSRMSAFSVLFEDRWLLSKSGASGSRGRSVPIFGLDALSSAAYGPEAALTLLIPLGAAGVANIVPISASIIVLLTIVYFSYMQTIKTYPGGGGSYTVARANLGVPAGLLAAAALIIDYVLVVAVGIGGERGRAGVHRAQPPAIYVMAVPGHPRHCCAQNLRGVRESGAIFMLPTYLFIGSLLAVIGVGLWKTLASGSAPLAVVAPPQIPAAQVSFSVWLLLKAFASGCTAMTGVEAVSNGVKAFREPTAKYAART